MASWSTQSSSTLGKTNGAQPDFGDTLGPAGFSGRARCCLALPRGPPVIEPRAIGPPPGTTERRKRRLRGSLPALGPVSSAPAQTRAGDRVNTGRGVGVQIDPGCLVPPPAPARDGLELSSNSRCPRDGQPWRRESETGHQREAASTRSDTLTIVSNKYEHTASAPIIVNLTI